MPWYTTADARRDAAKQAASKKRDNTMSYTFEVGKSGAVKATHELGAVELVPHWTWHAVALRQLIAERDTLRARLAELERAAREPVAWMWNDELGIPHASAGTKKPVWLESSASAEYIKQANLRPLYTAPPAPVAEIREPVEVDDEIARKLWREWFDAGCMTGLDTARFWLRVWQRELGPTLGMVPPDARADARIAELERECSQWREELRIYRETESARIAELEQSVTVRDTEIARLETDLELARMDGALLKQIERAAELLPNGYQVQLTVENGSAWVEMFDGRWWTHTERDGVTLADEVSAAVDAAIEEARAGNGGEG